MPNELDEALGLAINLAIFPSRVGTKKATAKAAEGFEHDTSKGVSTVPVGNNAYARTLRFHEALHQIHTPKELGYLPVERAVEDARLHLMCSTSKGQVRRDEVYSSLLELRNIKCFNSDGGAEVLLRSAAVLRRGCNDRERKQWIKAVNSYINTHPRNTPPRNDGPTATNIVKCIKMALEALERRDEKAAREIMRRFFTDIPQKNSSNEGGSENGGGFGSWLSDFGKFSKGTEKLALAIVRGQITNDSASLMGAEHAQAVANLPGNEIPKMNIHQIYNISSRKTFQGPSEKTAFSGTKIRAKKLATVVGPVQPRLFVRKVRQEGGSVLIDASGSMALTDEVIRAVAEALPLGTIAYYSGTDDRARDGAEGDLVIYADKGKRFEQNDKSEPLPLHHNGNLVDLFALQWLLKQQAPRYFVSDGGFTGNCTLERATKSLADNAAARKLIEWHKHLGSLLFKLGIHIEGVTAR